MQPKVLKTELTEYIENEWSGRNDSGVAPVGDNVLVLPDKAAEKTQGGIFLSEDMVDKHGLAAETGIVAALGEGAFKWSTDRARPFDGAKPEPGQRCYFERYAGRIVHGKDGRIYRLMSDVCVAGVETAD